jgi:hypothetical protein
MTRFGDADLSKPRNLHWKHINEKLVVLMYVRHDFSQQQQIVIGILLSPLRVSRMRASPSQSVPFL